MATITAPPPPADELPIPEPAPAAGTRATGPLAVGAMASIGAGAIHAAAVGVHTEHKQAAVAFALLALAQIGWGAAALTSRRRSLAALGALISALAVGGWITAKTAGIGFIDGLGQSESIQWPDFLAAVLALTAFLVAARVLLAGGDRATSSPPRRTTRVLAGVAVALLAAAGLTTISGHQHAGGHTHDVATGPGHSHAGHGAPAVPAKVFDPKLPIDLSGVKGVTPQQQARAENLVAITLLRLPQWSDYRVAERAGYRSIHDGYTGHEHFIKWSTINDDDILDPDHPESLVYDTTGGGRRLVSAMFMLPEGKTLDDVPDVGGKLTQWHIHDNLCFGGSEEAPSVAGLTNADGSCTPPLRKLTPVPMIHVWIESNPCGPFAALEGVAAGQIKAGETRLCDHVHGSGF